MTPATPLRLAIGALTVVLLMLVAALLFPAVSQADALIEAEPAPGETIGEGPEVILLRFDRDLELERGANQVQVFDGEGNRVDGAAEIAGYSPRTIIVRLAEPVEEGDITVRYTVSFADSGARVEGEFDFTIEPGVVEEPDVAAVGEPRSEQSIVLWTIAIMIAIALFAMMLFYFRVATDNAQSSVQESDDAQH